MQGICKLFLCVNLETVRLEARSRESGKQRTNQDAHGEIWRTIGAFGAIKSAYVDEFGAIGTANLGLEKM